MRKLKFIALFLTLAASQANAQLEKGSWMIGGNAGFSGGFGNGVSSYGLYLQPRVGYFVANKFVIGSGLDFGFQRNRPANLFGSSTVGLGISPFARYYFLKTESKFNLFGEVSLGLANVWQRSNGLTNSTLRFNPTVSAGAVYFIRPQIGIEAKIQMGSDLLNPSLNNPYYRVNALIGFQIHLNKPSTN